VTYCDCDPARSYPRAPFGWSGTLGTVPMIADGSLLRSEGETRGPVSPDNVHETGVSPGGQSRSPLVSRGGAAGRANSNKDLVTGPIRCFRALHAPAAGFAPQDPSPYEPAQVVSGGNRTVSTPKFVVSGELMLAA
jgi:hypothetical protein